MALAMGDVQVGKLSAQVSELSIMADNVAGGKRQNEQVSIMAAGEGTEKTESEGRAAAALVMELHTGVGFSGRKAGGKNGTEFLIGDKERWEMVCGACPNTISVVRMETGKGSSLVAVFYFRDEDSLMKALLGVWELRLKGVHWLTPNVPTNSQKMMNGLDDELSGLFLAHLLELRDGQLVKELSVEADTLHQKIQKTRQALKKKFRKLNEHRNLKAVEEDLCFRHDQIALKISEFQKSIDCIIHAITRLGQAEKECGTDAFVLGPHWTWCQLHAIVERECQRLRAQLPTYGRRSDIVSGIFANQVTLLVGETGSGKSTQLVQYLADAGYTRSGKSVVCTQPRKGAALALTERVQEESDGCLQSHYPVGCVTTCTQRTHWADINFATDYVLLQLCLTDPFLRKFSCVVVDEAHERSLNTDLLLALLKRCVSKRPDLKIVIMSATADSDLLSSYFGIDEVLHIPGRKFPVQVIYEPEILADGWKVSEKEESACLSKVIKKVQAIHEKDKDGTILAFLTSPSDVDWACRQDFGSSALVLPFYGKLPNEDLQKVFQQNSTGKRKIVFATNFAETSLTIPDVKFVVDSGLAKDSAFDPQTGMNVLNVVKIDQSSAVQRAGRSGRTRAGICYRLYSKADFDEMAAHRLPEIKRVHLGLAVLKLLALGIQEPNNFDFVEAPDKQSILLAIQGLEQLGAVKQSGPGQRLTSLGWELVRLGVEPRLGKILLDSVEQGYGQDGLVIAALMSNSRSIFYRPGSEELKGRADRLKMRFCHPHGDLFTLLSVYQEWDSLPEHYRNKWCVMNSISAKALRKCRDQVNEMRACLKYELNLKVSTKWGWSPNLPVEYSTPLRKIIFSAMAANLAVFSGHDRMGYDVVSVDQQQAYLHPSSAVLVYGTMPEFVVYGELLHTSCTFLVFVTIVDPDWIGLLSPSLGYNIDLLKSSIMRQWVVTVASTSLLTRVCGKQGQNLMLLRNKIQKKFNQRCIIDHSYENNMLIVSTTNAQMLEAQSLVERSIERERQWMNKECIEKPLVTSSSMQTSSPTLLFGAGGLVKDVLMPGDYAAVEVLYEKCSRFEEEDDEELLELFDQCGEGISGYEKFSTVPATENADDQTYKWGIIRFCSRSSAEVAVELMNGATVRKSILCLRSLIGSNANNFNRGPFPAVKATLAWARRKRKGWAIVTCSPEDREEVLRICLDNFICGAPVSVKPDRTKPNAIFLIGLDSGVDEKTLQDAIFELCQCRVLDVYMPRYPAPPWQPSVLELHQCLTQEISSFVPKEKFQVNVFEPNEKDYVARAQIRFEDSVHQEGTLALAHLEGLSLPGLHTWQKVSYQRVFSTQVHCSRLVLGVINEDLKDLMTALQQLHPGTKIFTSDKEVRFHRIQINGTSLAVAAGCKSAVEKLMEGQVVVDGSLGESAIRLLCTKKGAQLAKAVEGKTKTLVMCDKRTQVAKIYGSKEKKAAALEELLSGLAKLHSEIKCRQVGLRGEGLPAGLMREIVKLYGPDLLGLRELAGVGVNINIDHRDHLLLVEGGDLDAVMKVQVAIADVARLLGQNVTASTGEDCPAQWDGVSAPADECSICFCPMEDQHCLEGCGHGFCRSCLIDQINSAIRHREGFPLTCAHNGCDQIFQLTDIRVLLTEEQQQDLQNASLSAFVAQSHGKYRFCTTPDCPNVYRISTAAGHSFTCAVCSVQLCTACHVEYHEDLSCEEYLQFKLDPDASLHAWRKGKEKHVKNCPGCCSVIEKIDGCNHMTCKCGKHVCWVCLSTFADSSACYDHLRTLHGGINDEPYEDEID
ncbi:unnamed protein product [Calypogeia fissa]